MIDKKFIDHIGDKFGIEKRDLIEKDILLQIILNELIKNKEFEDNFAFKGGTCLNRIYFGYFRFSEDLDFTYLNKNELKNKSEKQTRRILSKKIDELAKMINELASERGLDFKSDKKDSKYIKFGGSNKFVTFKIWYNSVILNKPSFIKIQINFIEKLNYTIKELPAIFILGNKDVREIELLFKDYLYLLNPIKIKAYDVKEILIEKVRAILTRRGIKTRDFVDVFLITKKENLDLDYFKKEIVEKINDMLKYEKYLANIENKEKQLREDLVFEEEENITLEPLPPGFDKFIDKIKPFLRNIIKEVLDEHNLRNP